MESEKKASRDELKKLLHLRLQAKRAHRMTRQYREQSMAKMERDLHQKFDSPDFSAVKDAISNTLDKKAKKKEKRKLRELERKHGQISKETYEQTMERVKANDYAQYLTDRNHDLNILKLYQRQRKQQKQQEQPNSIREITEEEADTLLLRSDLQLSSSDLSE